MKEKEEQVQVCSRSFNAVSIAELEAASNGAILPCENGLNSFKTPAQWISLFR